MAAVSIFRLSAKEFCWLSRAEGIIGRDIKFTGYIHHYKMLTGKSFGHSLKNNRTGTGVCQSCYEAVCRDFPVSPSKGIIGRDLKFAGYVHHYKNLPGTIFGLILKNKVAAMGIFLCAGL